MEPVTHMAQTALAIFTFSPVQSFISEARRAEDLFNGSAILSRLAYAAAQVIGQQNLIYPLSISPDDMPNKLVAALPINEAEERLSRAEQAFLQEWRAIADQARQNWFKIAAGSNIELTDKVWEDIWKRQVVQRPIWQVFWVYVPMDSDYTKTYREASRLLDGLKHSRLFEQGEEEGEKDSLSGQRSALHTKAPANKPTRGWTKKYWEGISKSIPASLVKPGGKERLDSIALVKRFAELKQNRQFPSTSTVAGWDFYQLACQKAPVALQAHKQALDDLGLYRARKGDAIFPYDLDLLFEETLTPERMKDSYNKTFTAEQLEPAQQTLRGLYKALGDTRPSPYYALIMLDGDGIGKKLHCMKGVDDQAGERFHRNFSQALGSFAKQTAGVIKPGNGGFLVYNGGDDVLLFASLQQAIGLACQLCAAYKKAGAPVIQATLSGAVLMAHHLSPLSRALADLREAEKRAKSVQADDWGNKDVLCVALNRRGGELLWARSSPDQLTNFDAVWAAPFREGMLADSLPYMLKEDLRVAESLQLEAVRALVRYRFKRQAEQKFAAQAVKLADQWLKWVGVIEAKLNTYSSKPAPAHIRRSALEEGINWLIIARFLAKGGRE